MKWHIRNEDCCDRDMCEGQCSAMDHIDVVIVNFNAMDCLRSCLLSVATENPASIVVVDNASVDSSAEMVRIQFPEVILIKRDTNAGFGVAVNQGVAACGSPYALILNSDTVVARGALSLFLEELEKYTKIAVVGPSLLNSDLTPQSSCYPFLTPFCFLVLNTCLVHLVRLMPCTWRRFEIVWPPFPARSVPWVKGAALAIRRSAFISIGGFCDKFFMYAEDMDFCFRLRFNGWDIRFLPDAKVIHVGGVSTSQTSCEMEVEFFRSIKIFYRLHYPQVRLWWLRGVVILVLVFQAIRCLGSGDLRQRPQAFINEVRRWWRAVVILCSKNDDPPSSALE